MHGVTVKMRSVNLTVLSVAHRPHSTEWLDRNKELERLWNEMVRVSLKTLPRNLFGGAKANHEEI